MKKLLLAGVAAVSLLCLSSDAVAQYGSNRTLSRYHQAYLTENLSLEGGTITPTTFTAASLWNTTTMDGTVTGRAMFTVTGTAIRVTYDGRTTPTTTAGHLVGSGTAFQVIGYDNISNFQALSIGGDGTITVTYEQEGLINEQTP